MSNNIQSFEDSVKAKLKGIVADLIPEERYEMIVRETVKQFERDDLPKLVKEELIAKYREAINVEFAKAEWQCRWYNGQQQASEAVQKLLIDAAPLILASMIGGAAQQVVFNLQSALQNNRY